MADVTSAMLYLACGGQEKQECLDLGHCKYIYFSGLDESHNIVLPYSWPQPQEMANGPPILNSPAIKVRKLIYSVSNLDMPQVKIFGK